MECETKNGLFCHYEMCLCCAIFFTTQELRRNSGLLHCTKSWLTSQLLYHIELVLRIQLELHKLRSFHGQHKAFVFFFLQISHSSNFNQISACCSFYPRLMLVSYTAPSSAVIYLALISASYNSYPSKSLYLSHENIFFFFAIFSWN